ncbi:MAG: caspase family protein, partial [Candidatus Tectomicrobia bacterium]
AGEFVSVEQLSDHFSRPDLVARRLDDDVADDLRQALADIGDVRQMLAAGLPPKLALRSPAESQQVERDFILRFDIKPRNGGVGRIIYRVNGVVVGNPTAKPADIPAPYHRPFTLLPGRNVISATIYNEKGTVESKPIQSIVHVEADTRQPTLHILALGVADYRDRALQLKFAANDATAMVEALRQQGHSLFKSVQVTRLVDRQATLDGIHTAFRELAAQVQAHDVFVLFLSGHGITVDGQYHFIPADVIYTNRKALQAGSVDQRRLQTWLGAIKAQKSLVLLDTCYAGAFRMATSGALPIFAMTKGLEEKSAIDKLMRATGRAVIAASTERQFALEGYKGHGVFTYALLQGLRGAADTPNARGQRDGYITIDELADYVLDAVPELTMRKWGYEQFPMRQVEGKSFPIVRARP